ncbi:VIT1/CCC1 transporter family protein [Aeromicrobium wangtongii]|uniref:VIT1/CCC1 transporter family protein n=1 Tax=Aeromicrobium wangtongii TaxID=2969247 RepID=A0ABY5MGT4_9ACTN|nr:VIT1/CCC1 transporter family protein [Aeromicrobium wangtongii]MCD9197596.1 VIT1/CCC1 transporter family protein [Aeromicrobium wangtongii]UUP15086.1 VIT1/CCC1 transporter family protein [Aeromicrobium wangtongii]
MSDAEQPLPDPGVVQHEHPDVTGGWLRPAVFGAMDGLVSNFALMMGVVGGSSGSGTKPVVLAGLAGMAAGAFSMAAGEYTSVASQREFALAQVDIERNEILHNEPAEEAELAAMFMEKGVDEGTAREMAHEVHRDAEKAVRVHAREEFGVDVDDLASPMLAAMSSFFAFAVGAIIPLLSYLAGIESAWPAIILSCLGLFGCGALVTRMTARNWLFGGSRQLALGGAAAVLTYLVGEAVGASALG